MAVDRTRYNFNEKERLTKKALIFEVVKKYIQDSNSTLDELKNTFSEKSDFNIDMFVTESTYQDFNDDRKRRYFDEPFELNNGEKIFLSTQWGGEVFKQLLKRIRTELDYDIQEYGSVVNELVKDINKIKNIILYGSPGVGKTHNTRKLISLIERGISEKEIFGTIKHNEENNSTNIDDIKDRVKFITFHQSFGYEDFIEGFRPSEEGKIELEDGVFKNICNEAQKNINTSRSDKAFDFESFLNDFIQEVEGQENFEIGPNLTISVKKKINGEFQSFKVGGRVKNQSLTKDIIQRDFEVFLKERIEKYQDIKPTYESQSTYHGNAPYYFKLYEAMKKYLNSSNQSYESQKSELQNYYLVIDEINRGNISKIFGELITLIEEDKRDTLEVTLPYSKKPFKIPSNLYIIGTMNSTDKSIALIDIALRRRFTFLKMEPNLELVDNVKAKSIMRQLNEKITETLGADYVLGHSYFMKIENDDDLEFVLEYKIKPLLEEYFYGDTQGLEEILKICKLSVDNIENNSDTNE